MWKLVIADDERLIVKGLTRMVDWETLGIEVAGVAYDGGAAEKDDRICGSGHCSD